MKLELDESELINLKWHIVENKTPNTHLYNSGVYFLINKIDIVYIGQSFFVKSRVQSHIGSPKFAFDGYFIKEFKPKELNDSEAFFIWNLQPKHNKTLPKNNQYKTINQISKLLWKHQKITRGKTTQIIKKHDLCCRYNAYDFYKIAKILKENYDNEKQ
jgi:hypothetical protein